MPTGAEIQEDKAFVRSQGEMVQVLNQPRETRTWYRPDGLAISGLPVDPYHRAYFRKKGWTLTPPVGTVAAAPNPAPPAAPVSVTVDDLEAIKPGLRPAPPRHIHVMAPPVGSPCLVLGCKHVRTGAKADKSKQEVSNA